MANIFRESVKSIELIPIEDEFLNSREIFLVECINPKSSNRLLKQLMYLERKDSSGVCSQMI